MILVMHSWSFYVASTLLVLIAISYSSFSLAFFEVNRYRLGVDYGPRRIGLAISSGRHVRPLQTIPNKGNLTQVAFLITDAACTYTVSEVIVGVPLGSRGGSQESLRDRLPSFSARLCVAFARVLFRYMAKNQPSVQV